MPKGIWQWWREHENCFHNIKYYMTVKCSCMVLKLNLNTKPTTEQLFDHSKISSCSTESWSEHPVQQIQPHASWRNRTKGRKWTTCIFFEAEHTQSQPTIPWESLVPHFTASLKSGWKDQHAPAPVRVLMCRSEAKKGIDTYTDTDTSCFKDHSNAYRLCIMAMLASTVCVLKSNIYSFLCWYYPECIWEWEWDRSCFFDFCVWLLQFSVEALTRSLSKLFSWSDSAVGALKYLHFYVLTFKKIKNVYFT